MSSLRGRPKGRLSSRNNSSPLSQYLNVDKSSNSNMRTTGIRGGELVARVNDRLEAIINTENWRSDKPMNRASSHGSANYTDQESAYATIDHKAEEPAPVFDLIGNITPNSFRGSSSSIPYDSASRPGLTSRVASRAVTNDTEHATPGFRFGPMSHFPFYVKMGGENEMSLAPSRELSGTSRFSFGSTSHVPFYVKQGSENEIRYAAEAAKAVRVARVARSAPVPARSDRSERPVAPKTTSASQIMGTIDQIQPVTHPTLSNSYFLAFTPRTEEELNRMAATKMKGLSVASLEIPRTQARQLANSQSASGHSERQQHADETAPQASWSKGRPQPSRSISKSTEAASTRSISTTKSELRSRLRMFESLVSRLQAQAPEATERRRGGSNGEASSTGQMQAEKVQDHSTPMGGESEASSRYSRKQHLVSRASSGTVITTHRSAIYPSESRSRTFSLNPRAPTFISNSASDHQVSETAHDDQQPYTPCKPLPDHLDTVQPSAASHDWHSYPPQHHYPMHVSRDPSPGRAQPQPAVSPLNSRGKFHTLQFHQLPPPMPWASQITGYPPEHPMAGIATGPFIGAEPQPLAGQAPMQAPAYPAMSQTIPAGFCFSSQPPLQHPEYTDRIWAPKRRSMKPRGRIPFGQLTAAGQQAIEENIEYLKNCVPNYAVRAKQRQAQRWKKQRDQQIEREQFQQFKRWQNQQSQQTLTEPQQWTTSYPVHYAPSQPRSFWEPLPGALAL